ncbi:hypothetical protein CY35_01G105300 [Sphagnum magellanicum]|nr:hypothetical protein CY35_01G105300 [Sphagnum magellanicum]
MGSSSSRSSSKLKYIITPKQHHSSSSSSSSSSRGTTVVLLRLQSNDTSTSFQRSRDVFLRRSGIPKQRRGKIVFRSFWQDPGVDVIEGVTGDSSSSSSSIVLTAETGVNQEHGTGTVNDESSVPIPDIEPLFPLLQVQSLQEQEKLAATPAHPDGLYAMYPTFVSNCMMERVWRFGLPLLLAQLHKSLLPVAIVSFVGQFVIFAAGPWVGALMDSMPRVVAFNTLCILQTGAMLTSAGVTIYALSGAASTASTATMLLLKPWFLVLIVAAAIERLTGLASGVAFERDWVVLLAGANRPIALANANAILRRVELVCEIAGPFAFGLLLSKYDPKLCVKLAAGAMVVTLPVLLFLVHLTDKSSKGALQRPKHVSTWDGKAIHSSSHIQLPEAIGEGGLHAVMRGWKQYLSQPVLPASLAYVLLYFNAVLAPGGLMTTYLSQQGIDPSMIGLFRGMCAVMGFIATFLSASIISKLGVLKAGASALVFQASVLAMAVLVYLSNPLGHQGSLVVFLFLIVISRLGYWAYDMVDAQIFQTAIPAAQANLVGTTEVSLASLAELVMLGVAIVANDVSHFGGLAALSMASVAGAACVYWWWLANPSADQRRLFPSNLQLDDSDKGRESLLQLLVPTPLL